MKQLIFFLLLPSLCFSQQFPDDYTGDYSGQMIISSLQGQRDTVEVDFTFKELIPDSSWTYTMVFRSSRYGDITKDYLLKKKATGQSMHFLLDEQNGIVMEMTYLNECLYGMYEVQEQFYISTLRIQENALLYDLMIAPKQNATQSVYSEDDTFKVDSYKPVMQQTVLLERKAD
jgi:hypothetical protein